MIISNPILNPVRPQDSGRSSPANPRALPQVAPLPKAGQEFIQAGPRAVATPSVDNERIDLRVLNAAAVSRPEQRALDAYQSTAQLGVGTPRATVGLDETA